MGLAWFGLFAYLLGVARPGVAWFRLVWRVLVVCLFWCGLVRCGSGLAF